jgi:phosphohistidine phosphatase
MLPNSTTQATYMIKTLLILRHAHSNIKQPGQTDKQRELSKEGVRDAIKIGSFIKKLAVGIDVIVSSTANRTMRTATIVADGVGYDPATLVEEDEMYNASIRSLLALVNKLDEGYDTVLLVGHNPHLSFLAEFLCASEIAEMPPGGLVVLHFAASWPNVVKSSGELVHFIQPHLLD